MILSTATLSLCGPQTGAPIPETVTTRSCPQYEELLELFNPGWDVKKMSGIMYRESNCLPWIRSRSRDAGLLQINEVNHEWLSEQFGFKVNYWHMLNPASNIAAAAKLFRFWERHNGDGYQPWNATR